MPWKWIFNSFVRKCIRLKTAQDFNLASYSTSCCHFTKVPGKEHWYFADDVGYAFLLKLKFYIKNADGSISQDSLLLDQVQASMTERMAAKQSVMGSRIRSTGGSNINGAQLQLEIICSVYLCCLIASTLV